MRASLQETRSTRFFDRLTRRAALIGGGAAVAALGTASAQVATPAPEASPTAAEPISLLFVQSAGPTTLAPGSGDAHTLTLTDIRSQTQYFSDRPNRIAGAEPTATFVDRFRQAFADSPPNASLIGHLERGAEEEEAVVVTLLSAAYDPAATTLTYEVRILQGDEIGDRTFEQEPLTVLDTAREYAEAHLFIDNAADQTACADAREYFQVRFQDCLATSQESSGGDVDACQYCLEWAGCVGEFETGTDCGTLCAGQFSGDPSC